MDNQTVEFYDAFAASQRQTGINDRIHALYRRTKQYGLNARSYVLELGCGVGSLSCLFSRTATHGFVEAVDISPRSVEIAKERVKRRNVSFAVGDIMDWQPAASRFDLITLFDVVEHIEEPRHEALFGRLAQLMDDHTVLLVNVPNPDCTDFDRQHHPDRLQAIDLTVRPESLLAKTARSGLNLLRYEVYGVWLEKDYVFYAFEKRQPFREVKRHHAGGLPGKMIRRIRRWRRQFLCR